MDKQPTCGDRINEHYESRLDDLRSMWEEESNGNDAGTDDLPPLNEYGLCFDYVAPDTFSDQDQGFFRYQISYGGPSDEFRFYTTIGKYGHEPYKIEYWFLDWFDGAHKLLCNDDLDLLKQIWSWITCDGENCQHLIDEATA